MEKGHLIYQLGETVFAFRLSEAPWKGLPEGVYLEQERSGAFLSVVTAKSVRYQDAIEAQSRAIGAFVTEIEAACPVKNACRMNPSAWTKFERYAWLDSAGGGVRMMLCIRIPRFAAARKGSTDYTPSLERRLREAGRVAQGALSGQ